MMENSHRRASKDKKHPRVPIKTYKWEDVRRSRKRGGYPWTYLYKQPLGDDMDPSCNETLNDQRELSEWEELMLEEAEDISEVRELSATPTYVKTSNSSLGVSGSLLEERGRSPGIFFLDSAESSDDISQYLDKEDQTAAGKMEMVTADPPEEAETLRKRKVSEGSDHSRMSLGKSVMMKKIKDAKAKIKVPKLSIPTSRFRKTISKKSSSPPKTQSASQVKKDAKEVTPVYIHIPLKPPPGEIDSNSGTKEEPIKVQPKKLRSFKDAVKGIKHMYGDQKEIGTISEEATENNNKTNSDDEAQQGKRTDQPETKEDMVETPLQTNGDHRKKQEVDDVNNAISEMEATENGLNTISDRNSQQGLAESDQPRHSEKDVEDADKDEEHDSKQYNDMFDDLFKASSSVIRKDVEPRDRTLRSKSAEPERKRKMSLESAYSRKSLSKLGLLKKLKNASDKIKKAFSRPNLKQEKDEINEAEQEEPKEKKKSSRAEPVAPVYIHIPLKDEHAEIEKSELKDMDTDEVDSQISVPGKVELIILTAPSDDEVLDYNSSDVPETPSSDNKLFFGNKTELQELAKGAIDEVSPEEKQKLCTVSEEASENGTSVKSDSSLEKTDSPSVQIESTPSGPIELITDSSVSTKTHSLGVVPQSDSSIPQDQTHIVELEQTVIDTCGDNTLVDVEDGLSESKVADVSKIRDIEEDVNALMENPRVEQTQNVKETGVQQLELNSLATPTEETTVPDNKSEISKLKKKVSFRKKAKLMGDGSYEDVEVPQDSFEDKDAVCTAVAENGNKSLDVEAVILPAEEDDNKWSKISDHEYEPVNPPSEEFVMIPCSTTSNILTIATDHPDGDLRSPELHEHPDPNEPTGASTPELHAEHPDTERKSNLHKIQSEFKRKALDLKGKFHAMKRPHISLPARPVFHKPNFKMDKAKMSLQRVKDKFPSMKQTANRRHSIECNDGDAKKTIFSTYPRIFKRKSARYNEATAPDFATVPRNRTTKLSSDEPIRIPLHSENSMDQPEEAYVKGESPPPSHFRYSDDIENDDEEEDLEYKDDSVGRWDRGTFSSEHPNNLVTDLDLPEEQPNIQEEYKEHYSSGSSNGLHRQGVLEEIDSDEFFLRQKGISQDNIEVGMYLSSEIRDAFRTPMNALSQMHQAEYDPEGSTHSIPEVSTKRKPMKKPKRKKTPHVSQERIEPYEESGDEEGDLPPRPKRNSRRSKKQKAAQEDLVPYQETISVDEPHDRMFEHRESLAVFGDDERDEEANAYENGGMMGKQQPDISVTDYVDEQGPVVPPRKQKSLKSLNFSENDSILGRAYSDDVIPKLKAIRTESKIIIPIPTEVPERPSRSKSRSQIISPSCKEFHGENENAIIKVTDRHIPYVDEPEPEFAKTTDYYHHYSEQPEINCRSTVEDIIVRENEPSFAKVAKSPCVENEVEREPCVEEICKQDIRDCMGYAIIDKSKARDPPLPPPRIPKRRKKQLNASDRFATIQGTPLKEKSPIRPLRNYSTLSQIRKTRPYTDNYENEENIDIMQYIEIDDATKKLQSGDVIQKMKDRPLPAPPRPPRKTRPLHDVASEENIMVKLTDKNAEEAEVSTQTEPLPEDFVCEEVIQEPTDTIIIPTERRKKQMKPLPGNVEYDEGIIKLSEDVVIPTEGHEVPTESLVDSFACEEISEELSEAIQVPRVRNKRQTDTVINPTERSKTRIEPLPDDLGCEDPSENVIPTEGNEQPTKPLVDNFVYAEITEERSEAMKDLEGRQNKLLPDDLAKEDRTEAEISEREIHFITPTIFTHEETITHGSLLVEPLDGAEILPHYKERRVPVHVESNDEETSSIPEEFNKLSSPTKEPIIGEESGGNDIPRKQERQLRNLDIDTLTVNRLLADKIVVSELDAGTIKTNDISSESGNLQVAGFNLPPELVKEVIVAIKSEHGTVTAKSSGDTVEADGSNDAVLDETEIAHTPIDIGVCITEDNESANPTIESREDQSIVEVIATEQKQAPETVEYEDNTPSSVLSETADETFQLTEASAPSRPPRQSERKKSSPRREEPEVDDEPPPRPPQPRIAYVPSQPPASFYSLRAERYVESLSDGVPLAPRRRRHARAKHRSRSSSDDSSAATVPRRRSHRRSASPTLGELSTTLLRVCGGEINGALKRLVAYVLSNVRRGEDGKQDVSVVMIIVMVLIAGLILLGYGEDRTVVHLHHWDYFNPPTNM